MMTEIWKLPVTPKYAITSDAYMHRKRAPGLVGIDFISFTDKKLMSMSSGIVEYVYRNYNPAFAGNPNYLDSLGRFVVIKSYAGAIPVWLRYCHNERVDVGVGQTVGAGEVIGEYGYTGLCDPFGVPAGSHIHLDAWVLPETIDEAEKMGFKREMTTAPERWPGGHFVTNVDPTGFFTNKGLDVIKSNR